MHTKFNITIKCIIALICFATSCNSNPPEDWITYNKDYSFTISVPHTMELRKKEDPYSIFSRRYGILQNDEDYIVFQQKGLGEGESEAYDKYCRVIIHYRKGSWGDFLKSTETVKLGPEDYFDIYDIVKQQIGNRADLIGSFKYKWITINRAKCLQIDYKRTGSDFDNTKPVVCRIGIFQNNNEWVMLVLAYRENESYLWKKDLEKVYKSFKWIN